MCGQLQLCTLKYNCIFLILSLITSVLGDGKFTGNCSSGRVSFAHRMKVSLSPDYQPAAEVIQVHESPPSGCFARCSRDPQCFGYFLNYRNSTCALVLKEALNERYFYESESSSYYWKICLDSRSDNSDPEWCRHHEWAFDVVSGVYLSKYDDKVTRGVATVEHCMKLCLAETTFFCRSSSYRPKTNECILSRHDRRTAPEVFRTARKDGEPITYLERQCVSEPSGCQFKARGTRQSVSFSRQYAEVVDDVTTQQQCEEACILGKPFPCRSYQFLPDRTGANAVCIISPEDSNSISTGPQLLDDTNHTNTGVFEKESCVESEVRCGPTAMTVVVKVSTPFRGRLYALGYPYECYSVNVSPDGHLTLDLPLHGRRCGTRNLGNGTFVNSVVVQHHSFVLRTSDRRIEVACDYQELSRVKIKGTKGIRHTDSSEGEFRPISQHTVTAVAPTPPIRLRVVNASDQDVAGAELGDPLFLKVELADDSVYGIFGSDLLARSSAGSETVLLIDDNGCPVEPTVISSLERLPGSKSLVAPFQAFKFASDSAVKFQLTVSYCLDACPPVDCETASSNKNRRESYGRRRKRAAATTGRFLELQSGDVVRDIQAETTYLVVNNIASAWETDHTHRLIQPQFFQESPEGQVRIRAASTLFCVDTSTVYLTALVAGVMQLAILGACASLFFCSAGGKCCYPSWSTFRTVQKLMPNART